MAQQTYGDYLTQREKDIEIISQYFPELPQFQVILDGIQTSKRMEALATAMRNKILIMLGREVCWAESDIYAQLLMTCMTNLKAVELSEQEDIEGVTNVLCDGLQSMVGIDIEDDIRKEMSHIAKALLGCALEGTEE